MPFATAHHTHYPTSVICYLTSLLILIVCSSSTRSMVDGGNFIPNHTTSTQLWHQWGGVITKDSGWGRCWSRLEAPPSSELPQKRKCSQTERDKQHKNVKEDPPIFTSKFLYLHICVDILTPRICDSSSFSVTMSFLSYDDYWIIIWVELSGPLTSGLY